MTFDEVISLGKPFRHNNFEDGEWWECDSKSAMIIRCTIGGMMCSPVSIESIEYFKEFYPTGWSLLDTSEKTNKVEGTKHDTGKSPCELLSPIAMLGTADVLKFGAKKYAAHNWRNGLAWSRILGAILRHTFAFMAGEDLDKETGLPHVDHLACECMFLQEFYRTRKDLDDRYKPTNNEKKEK